MSNTTATIKVSFGVRRNLGNYEHFDASVEVAYPAPDVDNWEQEANAALAKARAAAIRAVSDKPAEEVAEPAEAPPKVDKPKKRGLSTQSKAVAEPAATPAQKLADLRNAAKAAVDRTSKLHVVEWLRENYGVGTVGKLPEVDHEDAMVGLNALTIDTLPAVDDDDPLGD